MATISLLPNSRNLPSQLITRDQPAYKGGEGSIFFTRDDRYVVKIYHRSSPNKQELLQHILDLGRNLGEDEQFLAWPLGIVEQVNGQPSVGVVTHRVPDSYVTLYKLIYSPIDAIEQFRRGRSWLQYLKIARGATAAVRTIHGKGMAHADIHPKNFLANPDSGKVVLIDLDGLVVQGFLRPQVKGTPGLIAPEVVTREAQPSELTDRHSVAVTVLWTLLLRNVMETRQCNDAQDPHHDDELGYGQYACFSENPQDNRNWIPQIGTPLYRNGALSYRILTPKLQALTEAALIDGLHDPPKRPQSLEWERGFAESYDVLTVCATCQQSFFYPHWIQPPPRRTCPFCGASIHAPFPAVLELMDARAKGVHVPVRSVVLYHNLPVFSDLVEPERLPPFTRRGLPQIALAVWDSRRSVHRLLNQSNETWEVVSGASGKIERGASVPLHRGWIISFGDGKRLARVVE